MHIPDNSPRISRSGGLNSDPLLHSESLGNPSSLKLKIDRPILKAGFERTVDVSMSEYAIASARSPKNILATFGLGPCISLAGYDPANRVGFLSHIAGGHTCMDLLIQVTHSTLRMTNNTRATFSLVIVGSNDSNTSDLLHIVRRDINNSMNPDVKFHLEYEEIGGGQVSITPILKHKLFNQ